MSPLLSRAENELQALLDAAVDAVVVINNRGLIEIFNPAAEKLFLYAKADMLGAPVTRLMNPTDAAHHNSYIERYEQTGQARIIGRGREILARRANGETFPASLAVGEIKNSNPRRYVGFIHDITERQRAVDTLSRQQALLSQAEAIAHLGSFRYRLPTERIEWSTQMAVILGHPETAAPIDFAAIIEQYVVPADRAHAHAAYQATLSAGHKLDIEFHIRHPSQGLRTIQAKAIRSLDALTTGAYELSGTLHDVTEQKRVELEFRSQVDRLAHVARLSTMGEMATGLAHEINQPLTAIATYAQALLRLLAKPDGLPHAELLDAIEQIASQALRAGEVIRRLRSLVKAQGTSVERINLNGLVQDLLTLARADALNSDIKIELKLTPQVSDVMADPIQIQQVLLNLVRNAIDATQENAPQQRRIQLSTQACGDAVEVAVSDHGPGIQPAHLEQIFDPFFTTKSTGTGLGLPISRSILRAHGGKLAYRPNPAGGATFYFTLPAIKG